MDLFPAKSVSTDPAPARWSFTEVAGCLAEISASRAPSSLTLAIRLVRESQGQGELVGWVTSADSSFYPPDAAERGVDLDSLVVVRVPGESVPRAGEKLLRSGAFGLVVLDVGTAEIPIPLQSRLAGLAQKHRAALLCLTEKEPRELSLGSLFSLRVQARRRRASGGFLCELEALKDKRRGPTWAEAEVCRGPAGLR